MVGNQGGGGQNLGIARGRIAIDTTQLEQSQAKIRTSAQKIKADLDNAGKGADGIKDGLTRLARSDALNKIAQDTGRFIGLTGNAEKSAERLRAELGKLHVNITPREFADAALEMHKTADETRRAADEAERLKKNLSGTGNDAQSQLRAFRRDDRVQSFSISTLQNALPAQLLNTEIAQLTLTTFNLVDAVPKLSLAFGTVFKTIVGGIAALGPIGVAALATLAGLAAIFGKVSEAAENSRRSIEAQLNAQRQLLIAQRELSSEAARARIAQLRDEIRLEQELRERAQDEMEASFARRQGSTGDLAARLQDVFNTSGVSAYRDEIEKTDKAVQDKTQELRLLSGALERGAFAANDAAAAQERLNAAFTERFQQRIATEETFIRLLEDGTVAQAEARRKDLEIQVQARESAIAQDRDYYESLLRAQADYQEQIKSLSANGETPFVTDLRDKLVEINTQLAPFVQAEKEIAAARSQIGRIDSDVLPALAVQEQYARVNEEIVAGIDARLQRELAIYRQSASLSFEQIEQRKTALEAESALIDEFLSRLDTSTTEGAAKAEEYTRQLNQISQEWSDLNGPIRYAAAVREVNRANEEMAKIAEQSAAKIQEIIATQSQAISKAAADRDKSLKEAAANAAKEQGRLAADAAQRLIDLEASLADKRRDIVRRANAAIANAVGNRDALAAFMADQQKKEDLERLREDGAKQRTELEKRYEEQKATIDAKLQEQNDKIRERYTEQFNTINDNARRVIDIERQRAAQEIDTRRQSVAAQQELLNRAAQEERRVQQERTQANLQIVTSFWQQSTALASGALSNIIALARALPATGTTGLPAPSRPMPPASSPIISGPKPGGGRTQADSGATVVNMNLNGATQTTMEVTSRRVFYDRLNAMLDEIGVARD